jgi:ppGpp synthetase/RelA/SpoT-type nucleotidyltranferase
MKDNREWLREVLPLHGRLTEVVTTLLQNVLSERSIDFLSVTSRTKDFSSALDKIERKKYRFPGRQMTDLSGIRVVTYLESQVEHVSDAIHSLFEIDEKNSLNRPQVLGSDKIGYRSAHFVCYLGRKRINLLEYNNLTDLRFEIQVRTVLQHAWAELAHDRSFKFSPGLPQPIQRRLNLYSGMLEIVDAGFDSISNEIDEYKASVQLKTTPQILDNEIDRYSVHKYIELFVKENNLNVIPADIVPDVIDELETFGVKIIRDLELIASKEFALAKKIKNSETNYIGLIRDMLMFSDINKYFRGPVGWGITTYDDLECIFSKWGRSKVLKLLKKNKIEIEDELEKWDEETEENALNSEDNDA